MAQKKKAKGRRTRNNNTGRRSKNGGAAAAAAGASGGGGGSSNDGGGTTTGRRSRSQLQQQQQQQQQQSRYGESSDAFHAVVMDAPLEDIREFYTDNFKDWKATFGTDFIFVSDDDLIKDETSALDKMKCQMTPPLLP